MREEGCGGGWKLRGVNRKKVRGRLKRGEKGGREEFLVYLLHKNMCMRKSSLEY